TVDRLSSRRKYYAYSTIKPLIRARSVVQVHPGPLFKSLINTRRFSLFPFRGISLKKPICQLFANFTIETICLPRRWRRIARSKRVSAGWHIVPKRCCPAAQTRPTVSNPSLVPPMAVSFANSRASRLRVHPFDPLRARCRSHEWIRKVLGFPSNLVVLELHDAHGVGRLAVIGEDEVGDPNIPAANDSSNRKPLFVRLTSALALYVAPTAGSLA